jgi:hypothetical protein
VGDLQAGGLSTREGRESSPARHGTLLLPGLATIDRPGNRHRIFLAPVVICSLRQADRTDCRARWRRLYAPHDSADVARALRLVRPRGPALEAWHADREENPAREILAALDRPNRQPKILLTGTTGTGKTTELLRVAQARASKGAEFVVFLDIAKHFWKVVGDAAAIENISSWEVCFLAGVALIRAAKDRLGHDFDKLQIRELEDAWRDLAKVALPAAPQVDVAKLARSMTLLASSAVTAVNPVAGGAVTVLTEMASSAKWDVAFGSRNTKRMEDQETPVKRLLESVNVLIDAFRRFAVTPLFIIDGLDRVSSFDRAEALFLRSDMIQRLDCPLVVCAPFVLRHHLATANVKRFENVTLHNAPVLDHDDPSKPGPGTPFLCELFHKRAGSAPLISEPLLVRLAYYSGGRARDFVKLVRKVVDYADAAGRADADEAIVERAIDEERRLLEGGLRKGHVQVLEEVARDPRHELPDGEAADELLRTLRLLPYRNKSEWFYPHPLLLIAKVRVTPTGSNG